MRRRAFLKHTASAAAILPSIIDGFSVKAFAATPLLSALQGAATDNDHVLVMIQLTGGNDGLNMVIPLDIYDRYQAARTNIAIQQGKVLPLANNIKTGLHPSMTGIQELYNDGKACIIQSVGYPSPDYSHFRAMDIWLTGSHSNQVLDTGWGGRYLDLEYPDFPEGYPNGQTPDPLAIQIGSIISPTFQGPNANMAVAITSATDFYDLLENPQQDPVPNTHWGDELTYIRLIAKQSDKYADSIKQAAGKVTQQGPYPANNSLAAQLKIVARLIAGGLKTRMYMVSYGFFDTHASQTEAGDTSKGYHAQLLSNVSSAIKAFMDDLTQLKASRRVVGMTFSEFGRRIKSNSSMGTDHGAAAPMIVFGDYVLQGVLGNSPNIPSATSLADNIPMQYDFRSVYASILEQWFCVKEADLKGILLEDYQRLPIVSGIACGVITGIDDVNGNNVTYITNYPNPFVEKTYLKYKTKGGHTMIQIFDTMGRLLQVPVNGVHTAGEYTITFDGEQLPAGVYYARFQNGATQQVRTMLKVR
jgi:uncharacterized protein (DUF1501 family)